MPCWCGSKEKPVKEGKEKRQKPKKVKHEEEELQEAHVTISEPDLAVAPQEEVKPARSKRKSEKKHAETASETVTAVDGPVEGQESATKVGSLSQAKIGESGATLSSKPSWKSGATPTEVKVNVMEVKESEEASVHIDSRSASSTPRQQPRSIALSLSSIVNTSQPSSAPSSARHGQIESKPLLLTPRRGAAMSRAGLESVGRSGSISMHEWTKLQADAKKEANSEKERIVERKVTLAADLTKQLSTLKEQHDASMRVSREFNLDDLDDLALDGDEVALAMFKPEEYDEEALEDVILEKKIVKHLEMDVQQAKDAIEQFADNSESLDLDDLHALDNALDIEVLDFDDDNEVTVAAHTENHLQPSSSSSKLKTKSADDESKHAGSDDEAILQSQPSETQQSRKRSSSAKKRKASNASVAHHEVIEEHRVKTPRKESRGDGKKKKERRPSTPRTNTFDDPSVTEETHTEEPQNSDTELSRSATTPRRGSHKRRNMSDAEFSVSAAVEPVS